MTVVRFHLRLRLFGAVLLSVLSPSAKLVPGTVTLLHRDAVVWGQDQVIRGVVTPPSPGTGTLYVNGVSVAFTIPAPGDSFAVSIKIGKGTTTIVARVDNAGVPTFSDTLRFSLGYRLRPVCHAYATALGRNVTLHANLIENPESTSLAFRWVADVRNPSPLMIVGANDSLASFSVPPGAPTGEYYLDLLVFPPVGDAVHARTFVTVDSLDIHPFNIRTDHAHWIDSAIVYGVTPSIFVQSGQFADITAKLPELFQLGVTALWIQPVYATHSGGQGYDVIDYFALRGDLGGESSLRSLIGAAHAYGLKVLFDFVPNHTSIYHPYAQDAIQYGSLSHYYDFYQRAKDSAPYSSNYNSRSDGKMSFIYYFWADLPNLNYNNPEVQRMIVEAGKYWIERLDIDGYRVDAVWGMNARNPAFMKEWRLALKCIKPEVLLLAEDKASVLSGDAYGRPSPFDERFDAAYDWTNEISWVSHWIWQSYYSASSNPTIFNSTAETQRVQAIHNSLTNNGAGYDPTAIIFRFMENNDTFRFLATHDLARTKMAGALLFSLNGIPLIFNGQEIGAATHPYSSFQIFDRSLTIRALDSYGLFSYYTRLAQIRKEFAALRSRNFQEAAVAPSASLYAYRRWSGTQNIFTIVNMRSLSVGANLTVSGRELGLDSVRTYYMTDLVNGDVFSGTPSALSALNIEMAAYSTRILIIADTVFKVTSVSPDVSAQVPTEFALSQNYPNPFNPTTTIRYQIPNPKTQIPNRGRVTLKVFDLLGREVATLVNEVKQPGVYAVQWDARPGTGQAGHVSSSVYFYKLQFGTRSIVKKMLLVK